MKRSLTAILAAIPVLFVLVYYRTLTSDYAYLDEAHQLWHRNDGSNLVMFMVQGRWLTGVLVDQLFASIDTIAGLKQIRLISLAGWITTTVIWALVARSWISNAGFTRPVYCLSIIFIIMSPSVAIAIGWASCVEIFLASMFGLLSGTILFNGINRNEAAEALPGGRPLRTFGLRGSKLLIPVVFGICSLFLYQNAFGLFLLPFLIDIYNTGNPRDKKEPARTQSTARRRLLIATCIYICVYILYFLLFLYQIHHEGFARSERTGFSTDLVGKCLFFFRDALPKAFSLNFVNSRASVLPVITGFVLLGGFIVSVIARWRRSGVAFIARQLLLTIGILALICLPSLAVGENFSSHRTLLPLSLSGFVLLTIQFFYFIRNAKRGLYIAAILALFITVGGIYNYRVQFVSPVEQEYTQLRASVIAGYNPSVSSIYFIRPDINIFREVYGIRTAKDEYGSPSTARDWVPEPLIRQVISELGVDRRKIETLPIIQFPDRKAFINSGLEPDSTIMLIDMDALIQGKVSRP